MAACAAISPILAASVSELEADLFLRDCAASSKTYRRFSSRVAVYSTRPLQVAKHVEFSQNLNKCSFLVLGVLDVNDISTELFRNRHHFILGRVLSLSVFARTLHDSNCC